MTEPSSAAHVDVLVVGAGLSGIGAACHLTMECPGKSFTILESRDAIGGTWDLFRYPGIRSDSDMFTLGFPFRPWPESKTIADGPSILAYVKDTAREYGVDDKIRFHHRAVQASWSTDDALWTVDVQRTDTGEMVQFTCNFLFMCSGYYRYDEGYTPEFAGRDDFRGQIIHPQLWPENLDYTGKRIVVIGSGATAVTLIPSLADKAAHVTMLQRSPTYVVSLPAIDPFAEPLKRWLPKRIANSLLKWKNVLLSMVSFQLSRRRPHIMKAIIRKGLEKSLPADFDIDTHFKPRYNPWDQRLCLVPDGDLFKVLGDGSASVVTDTIDTFTETGIRLTSGQELEADIIITATGLQMLAFGGLSIAVDGEDVKLSETVGYKGMMLSGVPNFAASIGYTNASWTLKCDLICEYVCRLLNHMDRIGMRQVTPRWREATLPERPFVDLNSGYVLRSVEDFPKQGERPPWRLFQNYIRDVLMIRRGPIEDDAIEFSNPRTRGAQPSRTELLSA